MPTDEVATLDGSTESRKAYHALPQLGWPGKVAMPGSKLAADAPADGPSTSGSTSLAVPLLASVGMMALLGLVQLA